MRIVADQRGFSLIEMLAAVTILAVGLLALAGLQMTTIRTNSHAANIAEANGIAQAAIERIQALEGDRPWLQVTQVNTQPADLADVVDGTNYSLLVNSVVDFNGVNNLTRIDVTVRSNTALQKGGGPNALQTVNMTVLKRYF